MPNNERDGAARRSYVFNPDNVTWAYEDPSHGIVVNFTGGPALTFHRDGDAATYEGCRRALGAAGFESIRPVSRPDLP